MGFVVPRRAEGPKAHLPVVLMLDRSGSTQDIRALLNQCSRRLLQSMKEEIVFRGIVELLVILYSSDYQTAVDFKSLEQVQEYELDIPESRGFTETGRALLYALKRLDEKKAEWKTKGERYYQPLLFLLTDGYPDAGLNAPPAVEEAVQRTYAAAAAEIRRREQEKKLVFLAAGIQQKNGIHADMERLRELTSYPERVFCVTDAEGSVNHIGAFYQLIYESTNAMFTGTPIDEVVGEIWDAL